MKVDRQVETPTLQLEAEAEISPEAARGIRFRCDDDVVEMRVPLNDWSGERLDQVGESCGRVGFPDRLDRRRRQHDIADQTKANEEDSVELVSW